MWVSFTLLISLDIKAILLQNHRILDKKGTYVTLFSPFFALKWLQIKTMPLKFGFPVDIQVIVSENEINFWNKFDLGVERQLIYESH